MSQEINSCSACEHYVQTGSTNAGMCRRYPKVPFSSVTLTWHFPEVSGDEFCGEFRRDQQRTIDARKVARGA